MRFDRSLLGFRTAALAASCLTLSFAAPALAGAANTQDKPAAPTKPAAAEQPAKQAPPAKPAQRPTNTVPARGAATGTAAAPAVADDAKLQSDTAAKAPSPSLAPTQGAAGRAGAAPAQTFDPNSPPAVEFDPPIADMGEMIAGVAETMTVKIRNISKDPIRITKAIANCGCTTPNWPKDPIAPGATGDIEVSMKPGEKAGIRMSKQVTFQFENHPPATLKVEGDVIAFVTIAPDMLNEPAEGASAEKTEIVLESTDGAAFLVTSVAPPVIKNLPTEAAQRHVLEFDWATWRETGRQMRVTFSTDNPKAARLTTVVRRALAKDGPTPPTAPTRAAANLGTTELITAVRAGDLDKMSALIAGGANVNEVDNAGSRTALFWAAKSGNMKAMQMLVDAGADANLVLRGGRTSIWAAVEFGVDAVRFLADHGGDLTRRDTMNSTPLLWAAGFGSADTVRYLLEKGADIKAVDDNGWSALIWAAGLGEPQSVKALLDAGADLGVADKQTGDTALLRAARTGKVESLKLIVDAKPDLAARNKNNQTALHLAAQSGVAEKVAILLAAGVDPAATDLRNWTALDHAMARTTGDKTKLIELLKPVSPAPSVTESGKAKDTAAKP
ncbi:MAG: DUF1573 domain-containing protein [Phycisphaera sp.]|nr:DUF1573 domain-containing protein [Phycisphaera sp.]